MASVRTTHVAEVKIRRYGDRRQCDVFVDVHGKEMILKCPDFAQAVKWARLECKSYQIESGFSVELIGEHSIPSPEGGKRRTICIWSDNDPRENSQFTGPTPLTSTLPPRLHPARPWLLSMIQIVSVYVEARHPVVIPAFPDPRTNR